MANRKWGFHSGKGIMRQIEVGDGTTNPIDLPLTKKHFAIYTVSNTTNASTSYEPGLFYTTMSGAGQVGGRYRFFMTTNVALGGWSNALKAEVTYGASGSTTGLGSAFVAEMTLSAGTSSGTYAPVEVELNLGASASTGTATSLFYCSVNGTAADTFQDNGYLFNLQGLGSATTGEIFQANTAADATHALKILIGATPYYIMLTNQGA
jgi:hypothetical protein